MDLRPIQQMARHIVAVAVAVRQEKMSLLEKLLMKMAL
jgi:hypothetical protein